MSDVITSILTDASVRGTAAVERALMRNAEISASAWATAPVAAV